MHAAAERGRQAACDGLVSTQIPALADVPATKFAMAVAGVDGTLLHTGDSAEVFSIQSLSKLFALCALLGYDRGAWQDIGWGPTNAGYGSVADLERSHGKPANPFVNSGAIVVTDRLIIHAGDATAATIALLRNADASAVFESDARTASSEYLTGHRNSAIAHVLAEHGHLQNPIDDVLRQYFAQCAITADVRALARAALFLADRSAAACVLDEDSVRRVNAVLLTSGMYGAAGDIAYRIGLPAKSGIGGGVLAIMPGHGVICVWSPPLDAAGNSAGGVAAIEEFARLARWSVF
ncbi:glutaminase A [Mycobacterium aquaticum]|uniref:Glutaminase n=1 Tax=Mycobacterium aquaticum TaxID=1927124 RepID=A0A1X0BAP9_9MYCO|nr:glutaminase A [Mycobacterium aquaticum]